MEPSAGSALPHAEPVGRTLAEERARNSHQINAFRFQAVTAFGARAPARRLSIPLIDMPVIFLLMQDLMVRLHAGGYHRL